MIHNAPVQNIETAQISSDEFWSFVEKNKNAVSKHELREGDCWIGMSQASSSGLILAARVGKHTDQFIEELIVNTEGKTDCKQWHTDDWGGYERVLPPEVRHIIGKDLWATNLRRDTLFSKSFSLSAFG